MDTGTLLYLISLATMAGLYAVLTLGLNLQWGFAGLFNAGIAGFFAIGAYTTSILTTPESPYHPGGFGLPIPVGLVGGALAAVAGVFLGMDSKLDSYMGWDMLLPVFAAAILGGIGSPMGAAAGGLVLGLVEELSTYNWIGDQPLLSPDYKIGLAFAIMVALLIWRPTGLLRGRQF